MVMILDKNPHEAKECNHNAQLKGRIGAIQHYARILQKHTPKEGRAILKEIFTSDADMIPDYQNNILTINLHSLSTPRSSQAVKELCALLNQTEACVPLTNLKPVYKTVAI